MRHKPYYLLLFALLCSESALRAQIPDRAEELADSAIVIMDNGDIPTAIAMLQEAHRLAPDRTRYPYEIAYAMYTEEKYDTVITMLEPLAANADAPDRLFELLGNCYDVNGDTARAFAAYERGLKRWPDSGPLHLEMGVTTMRVRHDYGTGLVYFEEGIKRAPNFPSNYYWAARMFCGSKDPVWGLIYGEIFMNLERGSKRTEEISKLLFDTYKNDIEFAPDSSDPSKMTLTTHLANSTISMDALTSSHLPFGLLVYEPLMGMSAAMETSIDLESLDRIRASFLKLYHDRQFDTAYANVLFAWQDTIAKAGFLSTYNHWLLSQGDAAGFQKWMSTHEADFKTFIEWFAVNQLQLSPTRLFYRQQYD